MRLFLDLPGLALGDELLEVGLLALGGRARSVRSRRFRRSARVVVDHAERDREAFDGISISIWAMPLVGLVVDDHRRIVAVDHLQTPASRVERQALRAAGEQHRLAILEPHLLVAGDVASVKPANTSSL